MYLRFRERVKRTRGFPGGSVLNDLPAKAGDAGSIPGLGRYPGEGKWQPTPVFLPGKWHGWRSPAGYSHWVCRESYTTE